MGVKFETAKSNLQGHTRSLVLELLDMNFADIFASGN